MSELVNVNSAYTPHQNQQDAVLLHFIKRTEEIINATLLVKEIPTPLAIFSRVLCEDLFLIAWIVKSPDNARVYQDGINAEWATMLGVSLLNGSGIIRDKNSNEPISKELLKQELTPKLKALKSNRIKIEHIAQDLDLQIVYDTLYRAASMDIHGKTFDLSNTPDNQADYRALSAIDSLLDCILSIVTLPRKPYNAQDILMRLRLIKPKNNS